MTFKQGDIVKSINRYPTSGLVVMVLDDPTPSETQFNGVVLYDSFASMGDEDSQPGYVTNVWNTIMFELIDWDKAIALINKNRQQGDRSYEDFK